MTRNLWILGAELMASVQARDDASAQRLLGEVVRQIAAETNGRFSHLKLRTLQVLTNANRAAFNAGASISALGAHNGRIVAAIDRIRDPASLVPFARRAIRRTIRLVPQGDACRDRKVEEAIRYIRGHYDRPISRRDLAERIHCSPAHFSRLFSAAAGLPFQEYIVRFRLEKAKELLQDPGLAVAEVATAVGYEDPFQFSKMFRKRIGISPRHFRKAGIKDMGMRLATTSQEKR